MESEWIPKAEWSTGKLAAFDQLRASHHRITQSWIEDVRQRLKNGEPRLDIFDAIAMRIAKDTTRCLSHEDDDLLSVALHFMLSLMSHLILCRLKKGPERVDGPI